jgi:hypothetical protein
VRERRREGGRERERVRGREGEKGGRRQRRESQWCREQLPTMV